MATNASDVSPIKPELPIPLSLIEGRYLLFDVNAVSYLRREHQICGYNIGTLPQNPSQNVFLGLPVIITPEEAQILVSKDIGYVIDDVRAHDHAIHERNQSLESQYLEDVQQQATAVSNMRAQEQEEAKRRALSKPSNKRKNKPNSTDSSTTSDLLDFDEQSGTSTPQMETTLSETPMPPSTQPSRQPNNYITPTNSSLLLPSPAAPYVSPSKSLPNLSPSYPLFRHLHTRGYYLTPGLRFGCQYSAYPGDPLRFHSHFLCVGFGWDEQIDLMGIVAGGRLGTGVKKGWLIGGVEPGGQGQEQAPEEDRVRTFSIEWAVM